MDEKIKTVRSQLEIEIRIMVGFAKDGASRDGVYCVHNSLKVIAHMVG